MEGTKFNKHKISSTPMAAQRKYCITPKMAKIIVSKSVLCRDNFIFQYRSYYMFCQMSLELCHFGAELCHGIIFGTYIGDRSTAHIFLKMSKANFQEASLFERGLGLFAPFGLKFRPLGTVDQRFRPLDQRPRSSGFFY